MNETDHDFTRHLGMKLHVPQDGVCTMEVDRAPIHMSRAQRAHGGVLFTMLDSVMGRAVVSMLPGGRGCATIEAKVNFFRPAQSGVIRAEGRCLRLTRRTAYAEGTIFDTDGNMLARSSGTFMLTENMKQADRERV